MHIRTRILTAAIALSCAPQICAQFNERASLPGSGQPDVDASGRSIKSPRIRAVHSDDPSDIGGTAYLIQQDPFLAYQLGRNLNFREFRPRDGVFSAKISNLGGPMPDGTTAKITANNQTSCAGCHNLPQGNPGGGVTFHKDSGTGRNSPHYYGAGIVEQLAIQTRSKLMRKLDVDNDGWVSVADSQAAPSPVHIRPSTFGPFLSYGDPRLSNGTTGKPNLNNIIRVWYVNQNGVHIPSATEVDGVTTFGYNFEIIVWGWGQGPGRSALNPTNRAFTWDPFDAHSGLESHDPSTTDDPDGDGVSLPTLAGAVQFPATHKARDIGKQMDPLGFSRDDPDDDGHLTEISEGDLDLGEWFMLNAPRPAFTGTQWEYNTGLQVMDYLSCNTCHVPNWQIENRTVPGNSTVHGFTGDRRVFDLEVEHNIFTNRLEGKLVPLYTMNGASYARNFGPFLVEGLFSDLRHHEMGDKMKETDFGGNQNSIWRTPPLWGVGSGFPWGHDGQSLTLDDVIRRHGGAAYQSRRAYELAPPYIRTFLLDFLRKLVLYNIESLPTDIDGDNQVSGNFMVAGRNTKTERFNPEWLFRVPLQIQGNFTNTDGVTIHSYAGLNIPAAYGLNLPFRADSDRDGWPDVWDAAPGIVGYRDGVK